MGSGRWRHRAQGHHGRRSATHRQCANRIFTSDALSRLTEAFGEEFPTPQTEAANQSS